MNPGGEGFTPQINNATAPSLQPNQPIPQQIPQINTHPNPVQNQAPQQQVPAMASAAQSPELEASTPVTGKSRIESAWGSNPEDMGVAIVSGGQSTGEIFKQEYTGWSGTLNPRWMRNWAIYRHHMLGLFKKGHRP